jgi:AraC-like DNA-binding protein/mannose-6-phosphate isomerase-like protein (cupin superfamily)
MLRKSPLRPIFGGTMGGKRLLRYNYWRTGYGTGERPNLDFYLIQAGEYHTKSNYSTGSAEVTNQTQLFYHLAGKASFESGGEHTSVAGGDVLIIPPHHDFTYSSKSGMKHHWLALEGPWPRAAGEPESRILAFGGDSEVEAMFVEIREILILGKRGYSLRAIGIFYELLARLEEICGTATTPTSAYPEAVHNAVSYLRENYAAAYNAAETAAAVGLSTSHLRALFEKWLGESPKRFHTRFRIQQAQRLLGTQNLPVSEVAMLVGFEDVHHFSRVFKQFTGLAPSHYAERQQQPNQDNIATPL